MNKILIVCLFLGFPFVVFGQSYKEWDDHDVVRFYEKIDLDSYTLDEDGEEID